MFVIKTITRSGDWQSSSENTEYLAHCRCWQIRFQIHSYITQRAKSSERTRHAGDTEVRVFVVCAKVYDFVS